ncbi:Sister chromatid cohesion protein 2 [Boothiomyces sp. JEL0866]|nr:Sister chromatid cohesion protein 2 [Boothiomyces sp. JEL0866]
MTIDSNIHLFENTSFLSLNRLDELAKLTKYEDDKECLPSTVGIPPMAANINSQIILKNLKQESRSLSLRQVWDRQKSKQDLDLNSSGNPSGLDNQPIINQTKIENGQDTNPYSQYTTLKTNHTNLETTSITQQNNHNVVENKPSKIMLKSPSKTGNLINQIAKLFKEVQETGEIDLSQILILERNLIQLPYSKVEPLLSTQKNQNNSFDTDSLLKILNELIVSGTIKEIGDCNLKENADLIYMALKAVDVKLILINAEFSSSQVKKKICNLNEITHLVSSLKSIFHNTIVSYFKLADKSKDFKQFVISLGAVFSSIVLKLVDLCQVEALDDEIVISLIFLTVDICFVTEYASLNENGLILLLKRALTLLGTIFANFHGQQLFIVDELIFHVTKYCSSPSSIPTQSGKSIHIYSFIVFQILQFGINVGKLDKGVSQSQYEMDSNLDLNCTNELLHKFKGVNECISRTSLHFIQSLVKKATDIGKETKGRTSTEQEYKSILDGILKDLLIIYPSPEWPVAELFAQQCVRLMLQSLEDQKKNENNFRGIATDWLGDFAEVMLKGSGSDFSGKGDMLDVLKNISNPIEEKNLIFYHMINICNKITDNGKVEEKIIKDSINAIFGKYLSQKNHFVSGGQNSNACALYSMFIKSNACFKMLDRIILTLLKGIDLASITVRTKSIRCFSELLNSVFIPRTVHGAILQSIQNRLVDNSPTVRDAAMDVCCRYVLAHDEETVLNMYPLLASRTTDLSVAVRKRVVKVLKELHLRYYKSPRAKPILGDTLFKLLSRLQDEESSVSDLAIKMLNEIYYSVNDVEHSIQRNPDNFEVLIKTLAVQLAKCSTSLNLFNIYLSQISKKRTPQTLQQTEKIICTLFNLIIKQDHLDAVFIAVHQFTLFFKELCSEYLSTLHPFIRPRGGSDSEIRQSQLVLMILNNCFSDVKFNNTSLVRSIETDLLSLLGQGSVNILRFSIPCLCKLIQFQTNNFSKIVVVLQKCFDVLWKYQKEDIFKLPSKVIATILRCLIIVSLISGNLNFLVEKESKTNVVYCCSELQKLTKGSNLIELSFGIISSYSSKFIHHDSASIGFTAFCSFLTARPKYFLMPDSMQVIDKVFDTQKSALHIEFFNVIAEYLVGQQLEKTFEMVDNVEDDMKIKILVGSADSFAEDGIPSSLVQTYLPRITQKMLLTDLRVSRAAFKVVSLALEYGLVHPIICIPGITALESCSDIALREQALFIHRKLHEKHSSFIHTKNLEAISCLYTYQKNLSIATHSSSIQSTFETNGVRLSFIVPIYSLIREKKNRRNEFLKQLVNLYNIANVKTVREDSFYKFIAECIAYLDFQTYDEVMHIVYHINLLLSYGANSVNQTLQGIASTEARSEEIVIQAKLYGTIISVKEFFKRKFKLSDTMLMEAKPASTAVSAQEKPLAHMNNVEFILNIPTDNINICNWFEELFEDNLDEDEYEDLITSKQGKREGSESVGKKTKKAKVSLSAYNFLFSEMLQYTQKQVSGIEDLEKKLAELGYRVGMRLLELIMFRDKNLKREVRLLQILLFINTTLWKSLFGKAADSLEKGTDNEDECSSFLCRYD